MTTVVSADAEGRISDQSRVTILEEAGVFTRDPSAFPGLYLQMDPARGLDPSFRPVAYDTRRTTGKMVHCSICAQRQEHFDGAIVRLRDGKVGLVGNDCGKRHFFGNDGWTAITNRIRQNEEQALFLARFGPAKEKLAIIDDLLDQWSNKLRDVEALQNSFKANMPNLWKAIARRASSGTLTVDEQRQVTYRNRDGQLETKTESYQVVIYRLEADWFFLGDNLANTVDRVRPQLNESISYLRSDATRINVSGVKRIMKACRDSLQVVATKQQQLASLSSENAVAKIANWGSLTQRGKQKYKADGKILSQDCSDVTNCSVDFGAVPKNLVRHWDEILAHWPSL